MKHFIAFVGLSLCLSLCVVATGCSAGRDNGKQGENEDNDGTTRRTQAAVLETVEKIYLDSGAVYFSPDVPAYADTFAEFLGILEDEGGGLSFDKESVKPSSAGYSVELTTPLDAWGQRMRLWVEMPDPNAGAYTLSVSSMGYNEAIDYEGVGTQDAADDIYTAREGTIE